MIQTERVQVVPRATRIVEGLRDTGYAFNYAIADIVDNSIAADATKVDLWLTADMFGKLHITIADDGRGMDRDGLIDAFRYGSAKREDPSSLGKFGLGLKTASTAFCRQLIVASRPEGGNSAHTGILDLDDIATFDEWEVGLRPATVEEEEKIIRVAGTGSGTVVIWEKIDRLLGNYKKPGQKPFQRALDRLIDDLRFHLGMVYQRFLDPGFESVPNVTMQLNGKRIEAWDPFFTRVTGGPEVAETPSVLLPDNSETSFHLRGYILPRPEEYKTDEDRKFARVNTNNQGIYVYRENRLIHGPSWLSMHSFEPHMNLLRVDLSFDHTLDPAFNVDIKKSRINLNEELYDYIRNKFLGPLRREANERYRKGRTKTESEKPNIHGSSDTVLHNKQSSLEKASIDRVDAEAGRAEITNKMGPTVGRIRIIQDDTVRFGHIDTAPSLEDGVLWETAIVNNGHGVLVNSGHPFYQKVYMSHLDNPVIIQALDYLMWSLAQAELNNTSQIDRDALADFRIDVSRNLRRLVAGLPDPPEPEDE